MSLTLPPERHQATDQTASSSDLTKHDYEQLAQFRASLRRLARYTELAVREVGMTPQQYQVLLAIKGMPGREWASISEIAERMQIRHNAVIGLVNRAEARGLVRRLPESIQHDRRVVPIQLTAEGERVLTLLTNALRQERLRVRDALDIQIETDTSHSRP